MGWFNSLDPAVQSALILSLAGAGSTTVIAVLGFALTVITSTIANRRVVVATQSATNRQIRLTAAAKVAEFRTSWINDFRVDLSELSQIQTKILWLMRSKRAGHLSTHEFDQKHEELRARATLLRGRLLLRLNPETEDADEKALTSILEKSHGEDATVINNSRKKTVILSRKLLKKEWEKVKSELNL